MALEASFLSLPIEIRNTIYLHVFNPVQPAETGWQIPYLEPTDPLAAALQQQRLNSESLLPALSKPRTLRLLQTCHKVHSEAHLLALSHTTFHVSNDTCHPSTFASRLGPMRAGKVSAIRHVTLTAKISHLRAMNETWVGYPFGNTTLTLETLTIIPKRPDASFSAYQQVADLSQGHTLAHIFTETFKCLKNVRVVVVRNEGCFNDTVWRLVYRSLVYRIWRWGGGKCGLRFEYCAEGPGGLEERVEGREESFRVWLQEGSEGREVGDEVARLVGRTGTLPDPNLLSL